MSAPLPEDAKTAVQQLTGPRYRPGAYPLLQLAKAAVQGHAEIAEKVREHAAKAAAEHAARQGTGAAESSGGAAAGSGAP
jgi:hypothetical protein